jgi:hypothetical protein
LWYARPFDAKVAVRELGVGCRNGRHVPAGGLGDRVLINTMGQEQRNQFIKVMRA